MKRTCNPQNGFTLAELLVVILIIAILAGLTLASIGFATKKAARDRAKSEIAALSVAIESYKIDNGDYPRDTTTTDKLNARTDTNASNYTAASLTLYKALSGDTDCNRVLSPTEKAANNNKVYFPFKPSMLSPRDTTKTVTAVADPFLNSYGYSTIGSTDTRNATTDGYNPTFDLWSTVDYNRDGSTKATTWITNW